MTSEEDTRFIYAGIYSEKYDGCYQTLNSQLTSKGVKQADIMFKRVPQEIFKPRSNCFWCNAQPCHFAFHHGEACKIEYQLELYKRFRTHNVIIIFLDVDVQLCSSIPDWIKVLDVYDILFEQESSQPTARWVSNINIGFTLCRPIPRVIEFYEDVLDTLRQRIPPLNWDQQVINHIIKEKSPLRINLLKRGDGTCFTHQRSGGTPA
jgi:hypothetical protein